MKLYYSAGSCSMSPHICLAEAGVAFELVKVNLKTHTVDATGEDFYRLNSKGYVPALELDNGELLTEGVAIVQYVADLNPAAGLAPKAGTIERVRLQELLNFISTELHKSIGSLFNKAMPAEWRETVKQNAGKRLDWIAAQLAGKNWLMGEQFTVADAYLFTVLGWTRMVGVDLGQWPALVDYVARVRARPKVQAALKAEGLL